MASSSIKLSIWFVKYLFQISYLWLLSLLEECLLALLLLCLVCCEVLVPRDLIKLLLLNTGDIDLLGSGDNVTSVDSAEGNTVDLERTSNEENTLWEVLQEDDALATETTSEENEDSTGSES